MSIRITQVDAFTAQPFSGNPAGVCVLEHAADEQWMQQVATEMNLSETAFLVRNGSGFDLRWFTPGCEVDLCGHATLASAHVLWEQERLDPDETAQFSTRSGILSADRLADGWIELDFPTRAPKQIDPPPALLAALNVDPRYVGCEGKNHLLEVADEATLRAVQPDFNMLAKHGFNVIVTSESDSDEFDFVSRYFPPAFGINEDPVTGSAHCWLGAYWRDRLGKSEFTAFQASSRGGVVRVRVDGDRTFLAGQAVTVMECLLLPTAEPAQV